MLHAHDISYIYITYMRVIILLYKSIISSASIWNYMFGMRPFRWCHQSQWFGEAEGNNSLSHLGGWKPCTYLDDALAWLKGNPSEKMSKTEVDASMNRIMTAPLEFDSWRHGQLKATMFCTSPWEGKGCKQLMAAVPVWSLRKVFFQWPRVCKFAEHVWAKARCR